MAETVISVDKIQDDDFNFNDDPKCGLEAQAAQKEVSLEPKMAQKVSYFDRAYLLAKATLPLLSITGQIYLCIVRSFGYMLATLALMHLHVLVRGLMDWKYDVVEFTGRQRVLVWLKLQGINLSQLRMSYEHLRLYENPTGFSMSKLVTQVVDALCKKVPQSIVAIYAFLVAVTEKEEPDLMELVVPVLLLLIGVGTNPKVMTSFETSMNKKACQKHRTILAFMTVDYLSRAIVFGFGAFILNRQDNGKSIIGLCIFCIYCNRVMLFWFTFFSRGYVYPMEEGKPHTSTSFTYKFLFAFFPAAFVQTLTDFPFNGDLATKRSLFALFLFLSWSERLVFALVLEAVIDVSSLMPSTTLWTFRAAVILLLLAQICLSYIYYGVKVPDLEAALTMWKQPKIVSRAVRRLTLFRGREKNLRRSTGRRSSVKDLLANLASKKKTAADHQSLRLQKQIIDENHRTPQKVLKITISSTPQGSIVSSTPQGSTAPNPALAPRDQSVAMTVRRAQGDQAAA